MAINPYQDVTDAAKLDALSVMNSVQHAALASLDAASGHPLSTRVGFGTIDDVEPLIFVSGLSPHTKALLSDPRCSLLLGQVGKGDPLTNPRLTLQGTVERVSEPQRDEMGLKDLWLEQHPKSKIYIDLPDFIFFKIKVSNATLIAGFGKAYEIPTEIFSSTA